MGQIPGSSPRDSKPPGEVSPWALAGLGMQFFVAILVFAYAGTWLDRRLGTSPLFLLGGVLVGGGGVFYSGLRRLQAPKARSTHNDDSTPAA